VFDKDELERSLESEVPPFPQCVKCFFTIWRHNGSTQGYAIGKYQYKPTSQSIHPRSVVVTPFVHPRQLPHICRFCQNETAQSLDLVFRSTWDKLQRNGHIRCINYETCRTFIPEFDSVFWNGCIPPCTMNSVLPAPRGDFGAMTVEFGEMGEVTAKRFHTCFSNEGRSWAHITLPRFRRWQ